MKFSKLALPTIFLASLVSNISLGAIPIKGEILRFEKECSTGNKVNIAATGDILMHLVLQVQAHRYGGYKHMWQELKPYFKQMDIVYGNLETPIAPGHFLKSGIPNDRSFYKNRDYQHLLKKGYSNFPRFNAGPELLEALSEDFNILSTANNHTFDRGEAGSDATIDNLEEYGFGFKNSGKVEDGDYTGTTKKKSKRKVWHAEITRNNIRIAFLSCTYHTNGINNSNRDQVLRCLERGSKQVANQKLVKLVQKLSNEYDALIVTPHWGSEYTPRINRQRQALSEQLFENGALAVLGD